jgi:hypothetical protein
MSDIVERLRFDAARCEHGFSKGVATNIEEAAAEIEQLRAQLVQATAQVEGLTARLQDILEADTVLSSVGVTSGTFRRHMADPLISARELLDRSPSISSTVSPGADQ